MKVDVRHVDAGDLIVATLDKTAGKHEAESVARDLARRFPNQAVLVLAHGCTIETISRRDAHALLLQISEKGSAAA